MSTEAEDIAEAEAAWVAYKAQKEAQNKAPPEPTLGESQNAGFLQGVPFLPQTAAAVVTAKDLAKGDVTFDNFAERYRQTRDKLKSDIERVKNANPIGGSFGKGLSMLLPVGGAGAAGGALYGGL